MMLSWLVYCLLVSALVSVAAWLGERASRAQGWAGRWAWAGALCATVGFPLWAWLAPPSAEPQGLAPLPGAYVMEALPPLVLEPSSAGPSLEGLLVLGWGAASGLLLLWLAWSAVRLHAAERRWPAEELDGVRVLVSERTGPAALGLIRGRVVLPRWALELDGRLRRLMVLHEAEHVRAADPQLALAGLLVCALMPWNVAAWWQLRRLRLAIEMDCDARVLRRSGDVRGYGTLLLEVGGRQSRLALGLAETRRSLERRIRMMTKNTTGRRTVRALGLGAVSALVLAVACETPGPTEVAAPGQRPVELDEMRTDLGAPDSCRPVIYLDGSVLPWEEVQEMDTDVIDTIEIVKGAASEHPCGTLLIRTKNPTPEELERAQRVQEELERFRERARRDRSPEELAEAPTFTPMHVRPQYANLREIQQQLMRQYPPLLRNAGIGGTTNVWFFVDEQGRVTQTRVRETSGYEALDEAALRVAQAAEFSPALLDGEPVPVWIALDITFESAAGEALPSKVQEELERREIVDRQEAAQRPAPAADRPSAASPDAALLRAEPVFTPMTERPRLTNGAAVREALLASYPPLLRDAGIGGAAETWLLVDRTGTVIEARVRESSGHEALDAAALVVARKMSFTPAQNGGEAVPVWIAQEIRFEPGTH